MSCRSPSSCSSNHWDWRTSRWSWRRCWCRRAELRGRRAAPICRCCRSADTWFRSGPGSTCSCRPNRSGIPGSELRLSSCYPGRQDCCWGWSWDLRSDQTSRSGSRWDWRSGRCLMPCCPSWTSPERTPPPRPAARSTSSILLFSCLFLRNEYAPWRGCHSPRVRGAGDQVG